MNIYHCEKCDQLHIKLIDKDNILTCCGVPTEPLKGNVIPEEESYHTPIIRVVGKFVTIRLEHHPMIDIHHIKFIGIETNEGVTYKPLALHAKPQADFVLAKNEELEQVFLYCNVHMLWKFPVPKKG
jgi:superoxide reductase